MPPPSPFFLGWDKPWLPRLAQHLLSKSADLSKTVIILPGRRAGRRLLELLAWRAQKKSQLFLPPAIMTLEEAVSSLLNVDDSRPIAGKAISRLAWCQASLQLTPQEIRDVQSAPKEVISAVARNGVATLAERLAFELGKSGLSIEEILCKHLPFFPESADREEPRWKALARLQHYYQKILSHWGYVDRASSLKQRLQQGEHRSDEKIFIAGVVDIPPLFVSFFQKINPEIIIIAPQEHASGFDDHGCIIPSYWLEHPAKVPEEILVPCERSRDQAIQAWKIIAAWKQEGIPVSLVAPDPEAISLLRETGAAIGFPTRWAGGHSFQKSSFFMLLGAMKKFLQRAPGKPPSLAAAGELLRHPITATALSSSLNIPSELLLRELDDWEREHLSLFLEEDHLKQFRKEETLGALLHELEKQFTFALAPEPLEQVLEQFRSLLLRLLDQEKVRRSTPEGHFFLECFEKLLLLLEELETLTASAKLYWRGSELLSFLLEMLHQESIPELEQPQAIEIMGWLEAAAEDVPSLLLTSFHEGAVPAAPKNDPLLSERLRKRLGLGSTENQLARDHYYLQLILASRKKEGEVTILIPRYNGRNEPVRPSRLLLQGCSEEELPRCILKLTQHQVPSSRFQISGFQHEKQTSSHHPLSSNGIFLHQQPDNNEHRIRLQPSFLQPATCNLQSFPCNVTSLRTYLKSPRLFYLQHVLKLREVLEPPIEITPRQFGILLHQILGRFSSEAALLEEKNESIFCSWLEKALEQAFQWQFGKNPSPAVRSQQREVLRALKGFARAEAVHRLEGWKTIAAEGKGTSPLLEEKIILSDGRSLFLQGRIDRLDWHPEKKRWLLLDYKTSHHQEWKKETPNRMHFQQRREEILWHDLQLPLYLKLATQLEIVKNSGLPLPNSENTDLCYFQLPLHPEAAGISDPFDSTMIEPAWEEAHRLARLILDGCFEEIGTLDATLSPTWKALCGVV